jgi:DNA-binding LytR/AlgR family response regulator
MIKAIAIDDEPPALAVLEQFCTGLDFIQLEKTFTKPSEALKHLRKFPVDLIFLDMRMPSMSGIELFHELPQETMVIFTTAYSEYAVEGFNLSAVDFLLKPFTQDRFVQAVNKAKDYYLFVHKKAETVMPHIFIRADYSLIKVMVSEILFIEGLDDYIRIHQQGKKTIVARMTMKAILEKLPADDFVRVHRSFIVPFNRIENVRNKVIQLGDQKIPVGASYEEDFFNRFKPS